MFRSIIFCIFLGLLSTPALAHEKETKTSARPAKADGLKRVLLFSGTGWFRHPEIPALNGWLVRLGAEHGVEFDVSETGADITPEKLAATRSSCSTTPTCSTRSSTRSSGTP